MEPKELNEKEENQATKEKPKENAINNKVKSIEIKEDFNIKIEINKWEQKTNKETKKLEVMFNIELYSELTKKKWNVYHSIQDFNNLIATLSQYFPNFPEIPKLKPPEKENSSSIIITKASTAIIDFINLISYRSDIINSKLYIDFFNLENHFIDYTKYEPIEKIHIKGLLYEVSDMILLEKKEILIVGCGNINDTVLSKMNFWKKKEKKGLVNIYKINYNQEKEKGYYLYAQTFSESEVSCMSFIQDNNNLLVGYYNGTIEVFEIPEYSENQNEIIVLVAKNNIEINNKKNRIINIGYNSSEKLYYCACYKDILIYSGKITEKTIENFFPGSDEDLCGFYYIENYNDILKDLIIEMDTFGKIYIGTINKDKNWVNYLYVLTEQMVYISLFKIDLEYNHIYIADKNGNLDILLLDIPQNINNENYSSNQIKVKITKILSTSLNSSNKGKITSMITRNFPFKINDVCYNPKKKEIIIALENGTVQIFSHFKNFPEYVIYKENEDKKENKIINKIYFSKLNSILYIGRAEKDIYVYQMPENFNSEINRRLKDSNSFMILDGSKICRNAIEQGFPKNSINFKKKNIMNRMGLKTNGK